MTLTRRRGSRAGALVVAKSSDHAAQRFPMLQIKVYDAEANRRERIAYAFDA